MNEQQQLEAYPALHDIEGQVIQPGHADYDTLRTVFYGGIDRYPILIIRAANTADVVRVVTLARESGLELAIRSGGHSVAGHGTSDGGIVLDLRDMNRLDIDAEARTAWAETGLTAGEYTVAAAEHGLATGFGDIGSVGLGGITLGGGVGFLSRKYGLTIDHLLALELVTADGQVLQVDAENHPDLFWALRGGGGNFGVVTRFKYQLHPVDEIMGGTLVLPATVDTVAGFVAASEAAPEELSIIFNVMPAPPMPFIPKEHHGQMIIYGSFVYVGDIKTGEQAIAPFRSLAEPINDMLKPMRYIEMYEDIEEGYHPKAVSHTMFIDHFDQSLAETVIERLSQSPVSFCAVQLRVLGGAIARVAPDATAYAHRDAKIMVNIAAFFDTDEDKPQSKAWVDTVAAALQQTHTGAYVNFMSGGGSDQINRAYPPETLARLQQVKAHYDPDNLFHMNYNIQPASQPVS